MTPPPKRQEVVQLLSLLTTIIGAGAVKMGHAQLTVAELVAEQPVVLVTVTV